MIELRTLSDLDGVMAGAGGPVILFKHSTACPVSARAMEEFEAFAGTSRRRAVFAWLDLLAHRDVSNAIAERLGVKHESPQAIVLEGRKVRAVLNHDEILGRTLGEILGEDGHAHR